MISRKILFLIVGLVSLISCNNNAMEKEQPRNSKNDSHVQNNLDKQNLENMNQALVVIQHAEHKRKLKKYISSSFLQFLDAIAFSTPLVVLYYYVKDGQISTTPNQNQHAAQVAVVTGFTALSARKWITLIRSLWQLKNEVAAKLPEFNIHKNNTYEDDEIE